MGFLKLLFKSKFITDRGNNAILSNINSTWQVLPNKHSL